MGSGSYGDDLRVQHRVVHPTTIKGPYCSTCGWRMLEKWDPHECIDYDDMRRIRHWAGSILSTLHFYRIPPAVQVAALALALAYALGTYLHPGRWPSKWEALIPWITRAIRRQSLRVERGTNKDNIVMDVTTPRLVVKKRKKRR